MIEPILRSIVDQAVRDLSASIKEVETSIEFVGFQVEVNTQVSSEEVWAALSELEADMKQLREECQRFILMAERLKE